MQNPLLPNKLIALTHCLRSSLVERKWAEVGQLIRERESLIETLSKSPASISSLQKDAVLQADQLLREAISIERMSIIEKIRKLGTARKVRRAYRTGR